MSGNGAHFTPDPSWPSILELAIKLWGEVTDRPSPHDIRFGKKQSKGIDPIAHTWFDYEAHEGGGYLEFHIKAMGVPPPPKPNGHDKHDGPWNHIDKVYPYLAADGALILQVVRTLPTWGQRFSQRRPDPASKSGWRWSIRDIPRETRPLYRLPELLASASTGVTVWITEGEKDCDNVRALGLIATCPIGGAGKWWPHYVEAFRDRHVVVLPDNDPQSRGPHDEPLWHQDGRPVLPGQDHAETVARSLTGVAASVRVLMLPNLPLKGDVSDWLAAGGNRYHLERLAREVPDYVPPAVPPPPPNDGGGEVEDEGDGPPEEPPPPEDDPGGAGDAEPLPVITCQAGELPRMVREAEEALLAAGVPVYQRSVLVRPAEQEYPAADGSVTHSAALVPITGPAMLGLLAKVAIWQKWDGRARGGGGFVTCDPPAKVVEILLANRGQWSFPVVRGVLTTPTIRPDGSLLTTPGYDPVSRYYLMFPSDLALAEIPAEPSLADAAEAFDRLNALLDDYDFVEDGGVSRSVALALLMTQVLRCGMAVSPLLAVSATAPGSGKSHLVDLASTIAIGRPCPIMGAGKNEEETEKGINTKLLSGVAGFSIDNVHRMVDNPILNIATERPMISIRLFGLLESVEVENAATIYMTGNNLPVIDEQVRRTVLCSLDAGVERPEQRDFTTDPIVTVRADRGRYIADILTIARAYLTHGSKPAGMKAFGSYPGWSKLVREPLIWLGQPDPVASQNTSRASDPEMGRLRAVMGAWQEAFKLDTPTTLADAVRFALEQQPVFHGDPYDEIRNAELLVIHVAAWAPHTRLRDVLMETWGRGKDIDTGRWGQWMKRYAGRIADGMMFAKSDVSHSAVQWKLVKLGG
jgi:putative DNA primase/helicase